MEKINKKTILLLSVVITLAYLTVFSVISIIKNDYTFLFSAAIIILLMIAALKVDKKFNFSNLVIIGISFFAALHIFSGNIYINGTRLYDTWLIDGYFKFDNVVHFIGAFVAVAVLYSLLLPFLNENVKERKYFLSFILILAALGAGAVNEIVELNAVLFFNAQSYIGGYLNNAFDLVFNLFGSAAACIFIIFYQNKKRKKSLNP